MVFLCVRGRGYVVVVVVALVRVHSYRAHLLCLCWGTAEAPLLTRVTVVHVAFVFSF